MKRSIIWKWQFVLCILIAFLIGLGAVELGYRMIKLQEIFIKEQTEVITAKETNNSLVNQSEAVLSEPNTSIPANYNALQNLLDDQLAGLDSKWEVFVEDLQTGQQTTASINVSESSSMVSASLIKLFIMGAIYEQVDQHKLEADSIYQTVFAMITASDNESANRLTKILGNGDAALGRQVVNDYAKSIGCKNVKYNRLMLEDNGLQNYVTVADCALILRKIYQGTCVNSYYSQVMLEVLKKQTINNRIPVALPNGTSIAHKTGDLFNLCCADVGIIFSEKATYILCVICNNQDTEQNAANKIIEISNLVYQYYNKNKP